jgi:hypothetical protein
LANRAFEDYPQRYARIGGALYLAIILLGAFAEGFVANKLVVSGDAAATARNILASPGVEGEPSLFVIVQGRARIAGQYPEKLAGNEQPVTGDTVASF